MSDTVRWGILSTAGIAASAFVPSVKQTTRGQLVGVASRDALIEEIRGAGVASEGGVMVVGNGFHEVRNQTDEKMIRVFNAYHEAGLILLFTEANALQVQDLLNTAWNTYHPAFRYVHEKSGQGLRPALDPLNPLGDDPMPMSWTAMHSP